MANEKRLIDANALIERCKDIAGYEWNHRASPVCWADAYEQFADDVEAEPTVDAVEVVHGQWEPHPYHPGFVRCSVCKERIIRQDMVDDEHFCSNCGAKMDGDDK